MNENYFKKLPDCIILKIFSLINLNDLLKCNQVCRRFNNIGNDKSLKKYIDLTENPINIKLLSKVISFTNKNLLSLKIKGCLTGCEYETITTNIIKRLFKKCCKIKYLEFQNIKTHDFIIQKLPKKLKHIKFNNCQFSFYSLFMKNFVEKSVTDNVECLDFSNSVMFDSISCLIINFFMNLKYLYLEGLFRINNGGLFWLSLNILKNLCILDVEGTEITNESFIFITKKCINLRELYIGFTYIDSGIINFEKDQITSKKLTNICLNNLNLNVDCLNFLVLNFPNLKEININDQLFKTIKSDTSLCTDLLHKLKVKNVISNYCEHYRDHKCDKY